MTCDQTQISRKTHSSRMAVEPDWDPVVKTITTKEELSALGCDNRMLVVQFSAPWCKFCDPMAEVVLSACRFARANIAKINTPDAEELVEEHEITKLPVVFVVVNGKIETRVDGFDCEAVRRSVVSSGWLANGGLVDDDF